MSVESTYMLQDLKQAQEVITDYKPFQLGVAAGPVDPADPQTTRSVYFNDIFAIRANSPNADAAWEFIKFINGEEFAKVKSRSLNNGLLSRMGISTEFNGVNLESFYKLKPKFDSSSSRDYAKIPDDFYMQYQPILEREMKLAQEKKKSIDEALQTVQDEAQALLDKALKDEAAKKGSEGNAESGASGVTTDAVETFEDSGQ